MSDAVKPDWAPLGINIWRADNYPEALGFANTQINRLDALGRSHIKDFGGAALFASLARQAHRNIAAGKLKVADPDLLDRLESGLATPAESVRVFQDNPLLPSMEIARLTHVGDWQTNEAIDIPVRDDLFSMLDANTQQLRTDATYRISSVAQLHSPEAVCVQRKRETLSHFGGAVLTKVVNSVLVDLTDKVPETRDLRKVIHQAVIRGIDTSKKNPELAEHLEDHMRLRDVDEKPSPLIPLSTIYYVTRKKRKQARH